MVFYDWISLLNLQRLDWTHFEYKQITSDIAEFGLIYILVISNDNLHLPK